MTPEKMLEMIGAENLQGVWYMPTAVGKLPVHNVMLRGDVALVEIDGQLPSGRVAGGEIYVDITDVLGTGLIQVELMKNRLRTGALIGEMQPDVLRKLPQDL